MVCDDSYLVINQTMICDGQPFCPYSDDEIGCGKFLELMKYSVFVGAMWNKNPLKLAETVETSILYQVSKN